MAQTSHEGLDWICLQPSHEGDHEWSPVAASVPETEEAPVKTVEMTCQSQGCGVKRLYRLSALRLTLYTHGMCSVTFFCLSCRQESEFTIPDDVAAQLDEMGVPSTIVRTPDEVLEWPAAEVLAIQQHDVEVLERSSLRHFNDCVQRELGSIDSGG